MNTWVSKILLSKFFCSQWTQEFQKFFCSQWTHENSCLHFLNELKFFCSKTDEFFVCSNSSVQNKHTRNSCLHFLICSEWNTHENSCLHFLNEPKFFCSEWKHKNSCLHFSERTLMKEIHSSAQNEHTQIPVYIFWKNTNEGKFILLLRMNTQKFLFSFLCLEWTHKNACLHLLKEHK